jgi:hypothetical protein
MSSTSSNAGRNEDQPQQSNPILWIGIAIVAMTIGLVVIAAVLAANATTTGASVRVVRDVLIIAMTLEVIVIGAAVTILVLQVARLVSLVRNEVEPIIEATQDTVNTVRGTAAFLSKNLVDPVTSINSTIRGISKVAGDVDAIRKAAGVVTSIANSASPMSTSTQNNISRENASDDSLRRRRPTRKTTKTRKSGTSN